MRASASVPRVDAPLDARGIHLDAQDRRARHRPCQRLRAAHPAEAGGQDRAAGKVGGAEMRLTRRGEGLVRALQDSLGADVDPAPGGHLAVHREAERLEAAKLVPRRPARHQHRIRDQHPRCAGVCAEHADGLAALYEQGLVLAELEQRTDERAQRLGVPRGLPGAAVDDELLRALRHVGIEVVEQHAQRRLCRPRARV